MTRARLFLASTTVHVTAIAIAGCVNIAPGGDAKSAQSAAKPGEVAESTGRGPKAAERSASRTTEARDLCALLTTKEASEVTGLPIERAEKKPNGCEWFANAAARQQQGADSVRSTFDQLSKQEPKNADQAARAMESMLSGMRGAVAPDKAVFGVTAQWENADEGEATMKGTVAVVGAGAPGGKLDAVEGLGDRAYWGPAGSFLMVRKGPALLMFGSTLSSREQAVALARLIVQRI